MFPIEAFQSTLKKLAAILHLQEIPFHLTGGVTNVAYSEPRMTQGIDIVVSNEKLTNKLEHVLAAFEISDFSKAKSFRNCSNWCRVSSVTVIQIPNEKRLQVSSPHFITVEGGGLHFWSSEALFTVSVSQMPNANKISV